jgi:hypothetical protein
VSSQIPWSASWATGGSGGKPVGVVGACWCLCCTNHDGGFTGCGTLLEVAGTQLPGGGDSRLGGDGRRLCFRLIIGDLDFRRSLLDVFDLPL